MISKREIIRKRESAIGEEGGPEKIISHKKFQKMTNAYEWRRIETKVQEKKFEGIKNK